MIVIEQLYSVPDRLYRVLQSIMDQNVKVNLLIAPEDLQELLEPGEEGHHLVESTLNDVLDHGLLLSVVKIFTDP